MNKLFNKLAEDERTEEHERTIGDNLMGQFIVGNWSWSVNYMIKENISAMDLLNYIEHEEECIGSHDLICEFDRSFFLQLGDSKVMWK